MDELPAVVKLAGFLPARHDRRVASEVVDVEVVGAGRHPFRDAYHSLLRMPWWAAFSVIALVFLGANAFFAIIYFLVGGVGGANPDSFRDAFFFSVQTMATIGYGAMYPLSTGAHCVVVVEALFGILMTAVFTGLVFAKFSQSSGRIVFSHRACIGPMNGVPTLMFRVGNDRASTLLEARVRVTLTRTERTAEGMTFYRLVDLPLTREQTPALTRSWTVMHTVDEKSPIYGTSPEQCALEEIDFLISVVGTDDTSMQSVHGRHRYDLSDIVWGARLADVLSDLPNGKLRLDLTRFHDTIPTEPTADFPYPKKPKPAVSSGELKEA